MTTFDTLVARALAPLAQGAHLAQAALGRVRPAAADQGAVLGRGAGRGPAPRPAPRPGAAQGGDLPNSPNGAESVILKIWRESAMTSSAAFAARKLIQLVVGGRKIA